MRAAQGDYQSLAKLAAEEPKLARTKVIIICKNFTRKYSFIFHVKTYTAHQQRVVAATSDSHNTHFAIKGWYRGSPFFINIRVSHKVLYTIRVAICHLACVQSAHRSLVKHFCSFLFLSRPQWCTQYTKPKKYKSWRGAFCPHHYTRVNKNYIKVGERKFNTLCCAESEIIITRGMSYRRGEGNDIHFGAAHYYTLSNNLNTCGLVNSPLFARPTAQRRECATGQ